MMVMSNSSNAQNRLDDLSGVVLEPGENPYQALIRACDGRPEEIQTLYQAHRVRRNAQQREKFLASDYDGLVIDQILLRLEKRHIEPGLRDERHCLVFWARPPNHVIELASRVQEMLRAVSPSIWLMPTHRMHMTTLEVTFSRTSEEIATLVAQLRPAIPSIASHTHTHRSRLVKPMVSYDLSAFALSFLPAAGEPRRSLAPVPPEAVPGEGVLGGDDEYTYHHLRRDVFDRVREAGVDVGSRYQVPSAHITLGRYLVDDEHDTPDKRRRWVEAIDGINAWLREEVWDTEGAEWVVGQEKGLDARDGTLWYGGGRTILLGEGF